MNNILPWQAAHWEQLMARTQQDRLPHALLFVGAQGVGKKIFAQEFARAVLCKKSDAPCGQCHTCHLTRANSHPDMLIVEPEVSGHMIKIDQIRELVQFVSETAQQGQSRVVIINPASAMNNAAANALLKTLEEPAPNTLLILICDQNIRLPATITSRCQKLLFAKPASEIALDWLSTNLIENKYDLKLLLNLAEGAPLKAKQIAEEGVFDLRQEFYREFNLLSHGQADPLQLAAKYQEKEMLILLNLVLIWLQDLIRFKMTNNQAELINSDYAQAFEKLMTVLSQEKLFAYTDYIKTIYKHILSSLNLNRQLLLEELFIKWVQYAAR